MTQLTFLSEEPPANRSASRDFGRDLMTHAGTSCSPILPLLSDISPDGWFGRTSPAYCHPTEDGTLAPSSGRCQLGYGFAYRVLDAQYFGVAQRRRRVFVVGYLGDWRRAAAVLFERESLSGHPAPRRETREKVAAFTTSSIADYREGCGTLRAHGGDLGGGSETVIAFGAQNSANQGDSVSEHVTPTLDKSKTPAVAFDMRGREGGAMMEGPHDTANIRAASGGSSRSYALNEMSVRRLTPVECERLQGFPDDYTLIPYRNRMAADGPRYKAMGNSMAVPVMRWIGERISEVEAYDQQ